MCILKKLHTNPTKAFTTITLEIKNKRNMQESLDSYVNADILEGDNSYYCERYNRKIRAKKRVCIKTLPNHLIVTLKRFEFDLNTMMKMKVNDNFEFPMHLNLKRWTQQGIRETSAQPMANQDNSSEEPLVANQKKEFLFMY
jgi:ubiquitin C-terminal hydrolase